MALKYIFFSVFLFLGLTSTSIAQQQLNKTVVHDGNTREYTVYIPASYNGTSEIPLLFNFHGGNGNIASQITISDMRAISDTAGFMLVYPQAWPDPNDGGSTIWTHKPPSTHDDIFFVETMINSLNAEYMIDLNRVYACGYSNGGEFTFELACRLSNRIAAIGVVARSMYINTYTNCAPTHPTAVVSIHGTNDSYDGLIFGGITYYISLEDLNSYWSNFNNTDQTPTTIPVADLTTIDGSTVEHYSWDNGDGCVSVEHFKVLNGGHDWPGSFGNMDIDASLEIWNFVSKYNINGLIGCGATAIKEEQFEERKISVYPNPTMDYITVKTNSNEPQEYRIYSFIGELVLTGIAGPNNSIIDLSNLPQKLYFLRIGRETLKLTKTQ